MNFPKCVRVKCVCMFKVCSHRTLALIQQAKDATQDLSSLSLFPQALIGVGHLLSCYMTKCLSELVCAVCVCEVPWSSFPLNGKGYACCGVRERREL